MSAPEEETKAAVAAEPETTADAATASASAADGSEDKPTASGSGDDGAEADKNGKSGKKDDKDTASKTKGGKQRRGDREKDETPIEELYDLSKPIPHVARPSKDEHEAEVGELTITIDALTADRQQLQAKIDGATGKGGKKGEGNPAAEAEKEQLKALRAQKGSLIDEKKATRAQLESVRNASDKIQADRKAAQSAAGKFRSLAEIEAEIARLHRRQETTSMSLADEKRLIKDIDSLEASKKTVATIGAKDDEMAKLRDQKKALQGQLTDKDKEIDAVQKLIDERSAALQKIFDQQKGDRQDLNKLFQERDALRTQINDLLAKRTAVRDAYRKDNNEWYNYQRAVRAQKQLQYEEEKKKREAEKAEWLKAKEEEELKKIPYEEEMALCDYLAEYLTRTYLTDAAEERKKAQEEAAARKAKTDGTVAVKDEDNPFANFKPAKKNDDDDVFLQMGKTKKKRQRNKGANKASSATFTLSVDSFEQFGLLGLTPPTSAGAVPKSVEELRARKVWYSQQERGAVKTAQDIRKENEKNAARITSSKSNSGGGKNRKNGGGGGEEPELTLGTGNVAAPSGRWAGGKAAE